MMPRLGDKLAEIEAADTRARAKRETVDRGAAKTAEGSRKAQARSFFEDCKRRTVEAISGGKAQPAFVTPGEIEASGSYTVLDPKHPDHGLFVEFQAWASTEGMEVVGEPHEQVRRAAARLL